MFVFTKEVSVAWFESIKSPKIKNNKRSQVSSPSGLWKKCPACSEILQTAKIEDNAYVCPYCDHHFRIAAEQRLKFLVDEGSFISFGESLRGTDPLEFTDKKSYKVRLQEVYEQYNQHDGTLCGLAKIDGQEVALALMDFHFMGGSMGVVSGEKIAWCFDLAYEKKIPAIVISCSGGARMQEGILSLMQLAKTSASRLKLKQAGIPYFSVLTDPTTGGCAASFAMCGDIHFAEPKALIGFAGPRVIEQSIRQSLPEGFQRSEFLLDHGFIDRIVHRKELKAEISFFVQLFKRQQPVHS
jgi:acetyl-CoA carboxylase carboxyl transferase subunit beta